MAIYLKEEGREFKIQNICSILKDSYFKYEVYELDRGNDVWKLLLSGKSINDCRYKIKRYVMDLKE